MRVKVKARVKAMVRFSNQVTISNRKVRFDTHLKKRTLLLTYMIHVSRQVWMYVDTSTGLSLITTVHLFCCTHV